MLYPGTIFGIAAHVSGETAKAVSTAVLSMPASSFGKWSLVTDFGQVKDLYRTLKRGRYAHLRDNPMMAFWMKWRGVVRRFDADGSGLGCLYVSCEASG